MPDFLSLHVQVQKQKPVHCIANNKNADMTITQYFHQSIMLEETPNVTACVSQIAKNLSGEKKVHLHPSTDGDNTSGSSTILRIISRRRARRNTTFTTTNWTVYVQDMVKIPPIFKIFRSTLRFGANLQTTAYVLHLGFQWITKTSKRWRSIYVFQGHKI